MHDINDEANQVDQELVESPELLGKECLTCGGVLRYKFFRKDSSYKDGRRDQCLSCESVPRMSLDEHTHRLKEKNFSSEAVKKQRWEHQDDYKNEAARYGRQMTGIEFLTKLKTLVPELYWQNGRIEGDLAVYLTYPFPQPHLDNRDFEYLWYVPRGLMPEFSIYQFDTTRDILQCEKQRGWRTPLLRCIKAGMITEEQADNVFGKPTDGEGSVVYRRKLWEHRNQKKAD